MTETLPGVGAETSICMRTSVDPKGVSYEVLAGGALAWSTRVDFGHKPAVRAGGPAFVAAAREQESVARRLRIAQGDPHA